MNLTAIGPQGRAIIERDEKVLSPSYTREYPLVVSHAEGSEVWDVDGRRYIDFMAGIAVLNVGHRHPKVVAAVKEQIDKFWHICLSDFYYPQAVDLAEKLQQIAPMPGDTRVFFGNSGTEAVEAAVKLSMQATGRTRFIGFLGAFHGRTLGALSFTASKSVQRAGYQAAVRVYHLPYPNAYRPVLLSYNGESYGETVINYLENELFRMTLSPEDVAGILIEPIQGEGGYVIPAPGFFPRLREVCDKYGIMLIVDEVQSGVGRTGKWWAVEHEKVSPDIVCFAKGIGSGLPLGGIIARDELMVWGPGSHGSTYGGNPVTLVSAQATIGVIEEENLMARAEEVGQYYQDALQEMADRYGCIGQIRGRGLMIGVEFVKDRASKERDRDLRNKLIERAFENGLLLLPCGVNAVRLTPPLNIPMELVDEGLKIFDKTLAEVATSD
jgi:4-aminobutyrate aminotransferase